MEIFTSTKIIVDSPFVSLAKGTIKKKLTKKGGGNIENLNKRGLEEIITYMGEGGGGNIGKREEGYMEEGGGEIG